MSNPSCLVCSNKQTEYSLSLKSPLKKIAYFKCPKCSLLFQEPNISFKEEEIYNADYIQKRSQDPNNPNFALPRKQTAKHYYKWLEKRVPKGNLLEIGCSTGIALKVAQDMGWKVFGVEVNESAAYVANELLKENVVRIGHLSPEMFPDEYFSLVTLFDVIEHIPDPVAFLNILNKKIAPGGSILFVTPDVESASFKLLKEKWPHLVDEHLVLLSPKSMDQLLKKSGFVMKSHGWATKYISLEMLQQHALQHPNAFYKPIGWILGLLSILSGNPCVFPFNIGEMYVLAEKG